MKRVSLIAAGLLAFGLTAARAEVGKTGSSGTTVTVEPPPPTSADVKVKTPPASEVDVTVDPAAPNPTPPSAGAPGQPGTAPPGSVQVDVTNQRRLKLLVTNAGDGSALDRASWGDAKVECDP